MRNHAGAIIGVAVALVVTIIVSIMPGCVRTDSLVTPGKKVNAAQLQQEAVTIQQGLDDEATSIQQKISADQAADTKLVLDYNAKVTADQSKLANAQTDLSSKLATLQSITSVISGIANTVLTGATNPASIAGSALTLVLGGLATGSLIDSTSKQTAITSLRNSLNQPAQGSTSPTSAPAPAPILNPVPFVVNATPPPATLAKAA